MSLMANPMVALNSFQQALNAGIAVIEPSQLDAGYLKLYDVVPSGERYSYVKVIDKEVLALAIFGKEDPIKGIDCYNVGYAVSENHRGRGLAVEAVNRGIEELKKELCRSKTKRFYVDAIIDKTNTPSIKVAKKLFPGPGISMNDDETGTPALYFNKLITLEIL